MRTATIRRTTKETDITLTLNLDGAGKADIQSGVGFFDHMLTAWTVHSGFDLQVQCNGDLEVDCHHSVEDVGIVLGQAFAQAIGDKKGIARFGNAMIPMDEAMATAVLDISNRSYLVFDATFSQPMIGNYDTAMTEEFWRAVVNQAQLTLHILLPYGKNDHHKIEAIFKAVAHSMKKAVAIEGTAVLSSKGTL